MFLRSLRRAGIAAPVLGALLVSGGCGGSSEEPNTPVRIEKPEVDSGDEQDGFTSLALPDPIRVSITRNGQPASDVAVTWSAEDGGAVTPSVTVSNEDGIAEAEWILGPDGGEQTATASVEDGIDSPVTFTADAIEPVTPQGTTIQVTDNAFSPQNVTVLVGRTVTWVWAEGGNPHNVVPADGVTPAQSGPPVAGPHTYVLTFSTPGVYTYYCEVHGQASGTGMSGTVTVVGTAD